MVEREEVKTYLTAEHHPACYPSQPEAALAFFREALGLAGKGELSGAKPSGAGLLGIVAPHIDFRVSLRAYAEAFRPLLVAPLAETYIILGVGHRSRLEWNLDRRDYETPLGVAVCARELVEEWSGGDARFLEPAAHRGEHSIEFPLLWLQALHRLHPAGPAAFRFVPLLCGGMHGYVAGAEPWEELHDFHRLATGLRALLKRGEGGRVRVIVSIDGCHVGPRFDHPFVVTPAFLEETAQWEEKLWAQAAKGEARAFLDWVRAEGNDRYFDGVGALALLLAAGAGKIFPTRTYYEQWFTPEDGSAVTFSSGVVR